MVWVKDASGVTRFEGEDKFGYPIEKEKKPSAYNPKVIDHFLPPELLNEMHPFRPFYTEEIPWQRSYVVQKDHPQGQLNCEDRYNCQFVHYLYNDFERTSDYCWQVCDHFIRRLDMRAIIRAKVNFVPCGEKIIEHGFHCDWEYEHKTAIYYINSNNGYTKLRSGKVVESKANRCLIMPKRVSHTGTNCTDTEGRIVLNINYL